MRSAAYGRADTGLHFRRFATFPQGAPAIPLKPPPAFKSSLPRGATRSPKARHAPSPISAASSFRKLARPGAGYVAQAVAGDASRGAWSPSGRMSRSGDMQSLYCAAQPRSRFTPAQSAGVSIRPEGDQAPPNNPPQSRPSAADRGPRGRAPEDHGAQHADDVDEDDVDCHRLRRGGADANRAAGCGVAVIAADGDDRR